MTHRVLRTLCFLALVGGLDVAAVQAQNNEAAGAVIGHVICSDTQQPARLAHVVLQPVVDLNSPVLKKDDRQSEGIFHLQTVGLDGSFTLPAVPPGSYYVIAEQDGYVSPLALFTRAQLNEPDEALKQKIARYLRVISVTAGHTTQADVTLVRGGVIAGMVRFEDGSPGINVGVQLLQRGERGEWQSVRTHQLAGHGFGDYTDDQGAYRFSGLPAGEYIVRANVELNKVIVSYIFASGGGTSYGDGYHLRVYPSDTFRPSDAKPVKVEEGENATNVDIDIPLSKLYTLSGTVMRPDSELPANAAHLSLTFADTGEELTSADVESEDGSFRFDFVPGGNYVLRVTKIENVERTEIFNGKGAVPPSHIQTKVLNRFGDVSLPIQLTGDQSAVMVQAGAATKAVISGAQ